MGFRNVHQKLFFFGLNFVRNKMQTTVTNVRNKRLIWSYLLGVSYASAGTLRSNICHRGFGNHFRYILVNYPRAHRELCFWQRRIWKLVPFMRYLVMNQCWVFNVLWRVLLYFFGVFGFYILKMMSQTELLAWSEPDTKFFADNLLGVEDWGEFLNASAFCLRTVCKVP